MTQTAVLPVLNYIAGEWIGSSSGETTEDRNPARSDEILGQATASTAEDVRRAIDAAEAAFREWRATPAPQRGDIVRKAADLMERRRDELARLLTQEEGKVLAESLAEVDRAIANVRFAAAQGTRLTGETIPSAQRRTFIYTVREPVGVVRGVQVGRIGTRLSRVPEEDLQPVRPDADLDDGVVVLLVGDQRAAAGLDERVVVIEELPARRHVAGGRICEDGVP